MDCDLKAFAQQSGGCVQNLAPHLPLSSAPAVFWKERHLPGRSIPFRCSFLARLSLANGAAAPILNAAI